MIKVLDVEKRLPDGSWRVHLLADSTADKLPLSCKEVKGLGSADAIGIGSTCTTPNLDIAMIGPNGKWGEWQ